MILIRTLGYFLMILCIASCGVNVNNNTDNKVAVKNIKQPNIVFILADDLGYGDVNAYNKSSKINTKHIDELASEGVRFTDAHTSSAVCTPTRYGILTGRYNWRTKLKKSVLSGYGKALIPKERKTIAKFLQENGYTTAGIGKWHLGWDWANIENGEVNIDYSQKIKNGPTTLGFEYWFGFNGSLDMAPYVWVENEQPTMVPINYTENTGQKFWRKGLTSDDFEHEQVLPEITKRAVNYINENANKEKPFFLYMPLPAPHTPILPTKEFQGKSGLENSYGDFVLMVDDVVGQITKTLEEKGIADNTIVVFTSDNGTSPKANFKQLATKNHNPSYVFRGTKADIFEGGHRVPFIVKWPEKVNSGVSSQLVCTTDFFATVADALDVSNKITATIAEDSFSFLKSLKVPSNQPLRNSIVHHSVNGSFAYREGDYKTNFCAGSGGWSYPKPREAKKLNLPKFQLYNLKTDIGETENRYNVQPNIVEDHQQKLTRIIMDGRSTAGNLQQNDGPKIWEQLWWINEQ